MTKATTVLQAACKSGVSLLDDKNLLRIIAQQSIDCCNTSPGGSSLTITEQDGSPIVGNVTVIKVTNGTLTDEGGGVVSIATGGGGGGGTNFNLQGVLDPAGNPPDVAETWTYTNTASGSFWVWNTGSLSWQQIV